MSSSTSSSRFVLILEATGFCVVFLVAHVAIVPFLPRWRGDGAQWEINYRRAESYLFAERPSEVVVVGSSISCHLQGLESDWHNVAQGGGGLLTGLAIVTRHPPKPRLVMIEINGILLDCDAALIRYLFPPLVPTLRHRFQALRVHNKPAHVAWLLSARLARPLRDWWRRNPENTREGSGPEAESRRQQLFQIALTRKLASMVERVPGERLQAQIDEIKRSVVELADQGVAIAFFEMPDGASGHDAPVKKQIRSVLSAAFPASMYDWVPAVDPNLYSTRDAVHLDGPSAARYSAFWAEAAKQILARKR